MRNPFRKSDKQVEIVPNQDFLEGPDRFVKGERYRVGIQAARYFERNGWIEGSDSVPPSIVTVKVDDADHGHEGGF